jgi:pyruvate carboxylase
LELRIIEKAAVNRTSKGLKDMAQALKNRAKYAEMGNLMACVDADIAFHSAIAESCGNSILTALYTTLSEHVNKFFMTIYKDTVPFLTSQQQHEELMLAIKDKEVKKLLILLTELSNSCNFPVAYANHQSQYTLFLSIKTSDDLMNISFMKTQSLKPEWILEKLRNRLCDFICD